MKISVIDLGFNSVKLVNYMARGQWYSAYEQFGTKAKLGEELNETGFIGEQASRRAIDALTLFRDIVDFQSIKHVLPIATSAVREAANSKEFLNEVFRKTGFRFKVLSAKDEAIYSYVGAMQSTKIPNVLFFDIGGGSLEIVYAQNFKIQRIMSLPLGALRLTKLYGKSDGTFTRKNYRKMKRRILELLPSREELGMNSDTMLVGVGGSLRALARYDQEIHQYPLAKVHNYAMTYDSVSSISSRLYGMTSSEIVNTDSIGAGRAETIVAGSAVINMIMKKFGFTRLAVSAHGLREGTLATYLWDSRVYGEKIEHEQVEDILVRHSSHISSTVNASHNQLEQLVSKEEKVIFEQAVAQINDDDTFTNLRNTFYTVVDHDSYLTHREQLLIGLSLVKAGDSKLADLLFKRYRSILKSQDRKIVARIASIVNLYRFCRDARAKISITRDGRQIKLMIRPSRRKLPNVLLGNLIRLVEERLGVKIEHKVYGTGRRTKGSQVIKT